MSGPRAYRERLARMEQEDAQAEPPAVAQIEEPAPAPPKPARKKAEPAPHCEFCDGPCRPVPDGLHRCECRNEPTNPKPDHWSLDPKMRAKVIDSRR